MTRIIGGSAGGRRLQTPSGLTTRPTSDRVREALFSSLEARLGSLIGLRFLDLYAGSGAIGLEAMSRGAELVTAVEADRRTAALVRANAKLLDLRVEVLNVPVEQVLATPPRVPYDVVFADPPYVMPDADVSVTLGQLVGQDWTGSGSIVVVERSARSVEPDWPEPLVEAREKRYGDTVLWYVQRVSDADE